MAEAASTSPARVTEAPVLVTGAGGFVAGHLILQLLEKGYHVRGTVRSVANLDRYAYLTALPGASERLEFVEADLITPGSFDTAAEGVEVIMHTASPYALTVEDAQRDLVDPAVQGTRNVLEAALKAGVKHVIVTSSVAAITDSPKDGYSYSEKDWNTESSLTRNPYYFSKVQAERAAWEFVKEHKDPFKLNTVNPFLVIGPQLGHPGSVNASLGSFQKMLAGEFPAAMRIGWGLVDVRDVAKVHLSAMENPDAEGRIIAFNSTIWVKDIIAWLKEAYPKQKLPKLNLACGVGSAVIRVAAKFQDAGARSYLETNLDTFPIIDNQKSVSLGVEYRDVKQSVLDTAEWLLAEGYVERK